MGEPEDDLLTPREVAALLGVTERTLLTMRQQGSDLCWLRVGRRFVRYRRRDVRAYLEGQERAPLGGVA